MTSLTRSLVALLALGCSTTAFAQANVQPRESDDAGEIVAFDILIWEN